VGFRPNDRRISRPVARSTESIETAKHERHVACAVDILLKSGFEDGPFRTTDIRAAASDTGAELYLWGSRRRPWQSLPDRCFARLLWAHRAGG
jgi:hypothetical protein